MKKKKLLKSALAGALAVSALLGTSEQAFAVDSSNANQGYDDVMDTIVGSGSDTTFLMMQKIELLYNQTPGCKLKTGPLAADRACTVPSSVTPITTENYDHDVVVGEYPIGSSNGIARVINGSVDYGRSSRTRKTDGTEDTAVFAGYAKGAIVPITFNGRTTGNFTKQDLLDIFVNCTKNNWSQFGQPAAPIRPYGVQTGSGTYTSFFNYLGADPNTCANAIGAGRVLFENNTSPIDGGQDTDGAVFATAADRDNAVWFMEFADVQTSPSRRGTAGFWTVDGQSPSPASQIANNVYPITRFMWQVNLKTQLTATGGKAGAAGAFTEWLCRSGAASHGTNFNSGNNIFNDIGTAITSSGFVRTPSAQSDLHPVSGVQTRCKFDFKTPF